MIYSIAVLGAGIMGHGIAHAAMTAGFDTRLFDVSEKALALARTEIESIGRVGVERGKVTSSEVTDSMERLTLCQDIASAVDGIGLVIEAVPEQMDLKLALLNDLEQLAPQQAIIASNTSALSLTEMSAALSDPGRAVGMHFFNPVHKMKLVEIVRTLDTTSETIHTIEEIGRRMGKETVVIRESPGFVTSRINATIGNEAFFMLQEGIASARDIDKALKLGLNHPMGPFELVDLVGLDTRLSVLKFLHRTLGEKYRPCPLLEEYVQAGRLGKKAGKGVYEY